VHDETAPCSATDPAPTLHHNSSHPHPWDPYQHSLPAFTLVPSPLLYAQTQPPPPPHTRASAHALLIPIILLQGNSLWRVICTGTTHCVRNTRACQGDVNREHAEAELGNKGSARRCSSMQQRCSRGACRMRPQRTSCPKGVVEGRLLFCYNFPALFAHFAGTPVVPCLFEMSTK